QFAVYNNLDTKKNVLIYYEYGHEGYLPMLGDKIYQWAINN
ncbi:MAG: acetylxylan esterase, partial [Sarcina sp.]